MSISRRDFVQSALVGAAALSVPGYGNGQAIPAQGNGKARLPVIIGPPNGLKYLDEAYSLLAAGGDTLDAALKVVQGPENDPNDESVGLSSQRRRSGRARRLLHSWTDTHGGSGRRRA